MADARNPLQYIKGEISAPAPTGLLKCESIVDGCRNAMSEPEPEPLYKGLWYERELCCLFSYTNVGKSVLAMQIGIELSESGRPVLLADFEMSWKGVQGRLSDSNGKLRDISRKFYRAEIDPRNYNPDTFESDIIDSIKTKCQELHTDILIIDNLSWLCNNVEKGNAAGAFMQKMLMLRDELRISILVVAHTPKRSEFSPLTGNDLAGSMRILNFCDSAFAIGKSSQGDDIRYVKQIKTRQGRLMYGADNVITCRLTKDGGWLHFEETGTSREKDHLKEWNETERVNLKQQCENLVKEGLSQSEIARKLGISQATVSRYTKK